MKKNNLILCACLFTSSLNTMNTHITPQTMNIGQQKFLNIEQNAALKQDDIWEQGSKKCSCGIGKTWPEEYCFDITGDHFKIPLCDCNQKNFGNKLDTNAIFNTKRWNKQELAKNGDINWDSKQEFSTIIDFFYKNSSTNTPSLREKENGQTLNFFTKHFQIHGSTVFAPENDDSVLFCSNQHSTIIHKNRNIPDQLILICLAEQKSNFLRKLDQPCGGIMWSAQANQPALMAYAINMHQTNKFQSTLTCLGKIASYEHLPDNSYLYVRSYQDHDDTVKIVCCDKQASFLDTFTITVDSLPAKLMGVIKTKIMRNKKSQDVHFLYI